MLWVLTMTDLPLHHLRSQVPRETPFFTQALEQARQHRCYHGGQTEVQATVSRKESRTKLKRGSAVRRAAVSRHRTDLQAQTM